MGPAILHHLEGLPVHSLDLPSLYSECLSTEEACARVSFISILPEASFKPCNDRYATLELKTFLFQIFREARRNTPSILYLPHIDQWWTTVNEPVVAIFHSLLCNIMPASPIFFLATSDCEFSDLPLEVSCFLFHPFK